MKCKDCKFKVKNKTKYNGKAEFNGYCSRECLERAVLSNHLAVLGRGDKLLVRTKSDAAKVVVRVEYYTIRCGKIIFGKKVAVDDGYGVVVRSLPARDISIEIVPASERSRFYITSLSISDSNGLVAYTLSKFVAGEGIVTDDESNIGLTQWGMAAHVVVGTSKILGAKILQIDADAVLKSGIDVLYHLYFKKMFLPFFERLHGAGVAVVIGWTGTDVKELLEDAEMGRVVSGINKHTYLSLARTKYQYDELKQAGIENVVIMNTPSAKVFDVMPLPEKFTVGVYVPAHRSEFYGLSRVLDIAKRLPSIDFLIYAHDAKMRAPANVRVAGYMDAYEVYKSVSCILRIVEHDGFPHTFMEAGMAGRALVHNLYQYPFAHLCKSDDEIVAKLTELSKVMRGPNIEQSNYYREHYAPDAFAAEFKRVVADVMEERKHKAQLRLMSINDISIAVVSWGGNFFVDRILPELGKYVRIKKYDRSFGGVVAEDVLWVVSPSDKARDVVRNALAHNRVVVAHWIGSDVLKHKRWREDVRKLFARARHITVSRDLARELEYDVDEVMNLVSAKQLVLAPLPEKFTVLVYYKYNSVCGLEDLYNQALMRDVVKECADIDFVFYGVKGNVGFRAPNLEIVGWTDDVESVYSKGSCLLRVTKHDGFPMSVVEASMMGRHIVTNHDLPFVWYVDGLEDIVRTLRELKTRRELNLSGSSFYRRTHSREAFVNRFLTFVGDVA